MTVEPMQPYLEPIRKSVVVPKSPSEAFRIFTEDMATWWPLPSYSISGQHATACGIEPAIGGLVYEIRDDGARFPWGRVLVWEPPGRLVLAWHPGREPSDAQELELRFTADGAGTRVDLEHRGWSTADTGVSARRSSYDRGWDTVLGRRFADACA